MVVASISGIRGIINEDLPVSELLPPVRIFAAQNKSKEFLVGRDTRPTGELILRAIAASLMAEGVNVVDYGVLSTPALFRESRLRDAPAVMVTASHNEPEWNGVKFIAKGRGISQEALDQVLGRATPEVARIAPGALTARRSSYNLELIDRGGRGSCDGVRVVTDVNGGASVNHAPSILSSLGCMVTVLGGNQGIFDRIIDPTADDLRQLCRTSTSKGADVGFAFDCDGDRLVLVDDKGAKQTGDFMLTLSIKLMLPALKERKVVVSVDTTSAVDEVVKRMGGTVYRSKVGEANVVSKMVETGATLGGEGSSGGLIDGSYNYCRDSMLAAIAITKAIAASGSRIFSQVPSYAQVRLKVPMDRRKALEAVKRLQKENPYADTTDGVKVRLSRGSWVLVRVSGTEDAVRVSAESRSRAAAQEIAETYLKRVKRLG